jgi:hypothetical protein
MGASQHFAHGDLRSVRLLGRPGAATRSARFADWSEETWKTAQRLLANELLDIVSNDSAMLSLVQQTVLVPLELELMRTEATSGLTAYELLQSTRAALRSSIS